MNARTATFKQFWNKYIWSRDFNLKNPSDWKGLFGWKNTAGVQVTKENAHSLTTVFAAVKIISETISSLPLNVYKREGANKEIFVDHPSYYLLHHEPNPLMTSMVFWEKILGSFLLWGNGYAIIKRDGGMRPLELEFIPPWDCEPHIVDDRLWYKIKGREQLISAVDMFHIPDQSFNGVKGISRIDKCARSLGVNIATEDYSAKLYENGLNLNGVMKTPYGDPTKEQLDHLSLKWREKHTGSDSQKTAFLPAGFEFQQISMPPEQAQFIETKKFGVEEIARVFNMPVNKLRDYSKSTFTNVEHQNIEFVTETIRPLLKKIEQELDRKMFREDQKGKVFTKFIVEALLRGDKKTQTEYYKTMMDRGVLSINDVLSLENMNEIGEKGDLRFVQQNMHTLENAAQIKEAG